MSVTKMPTVSDVDAPCTMRDQTSQPCRVNPSGCPSVGAPLLLASWQFEFGGSFVNRPGNSATNTMMRISDAEIQNIGRRRRSAHASIQRFEGLPSALMVSIASSGVSSSGAT